MKQDGFVLFPPDPGTLAWVAAAAATARDIAQEPKMRAANLRHGDTWFVGVDALPNAGDGSIGGVPLIGPWQDQVPDLALHRAQLSIIYPGYPQQDPSESDAAHRFRRSRAAAHVDGLLPIGANRRRFAREHHAYILGLPLNETAQAPTTVWRGSHRIMQAALQTVITDHPVGEVDVTDAYADARRTVFEQCERVDLRVAPGGAMLLHRFVLHGTTPWEESLGASPAEGRMTAFFRPEISAKGWLWDI